MKTVPSVIMFAFAVVCWVPGCGDSGGQTADAPPGTPDSPPGTIDASPDAPIGAVCGGKSGTTCSATQYCDFPDNGCGFADGTGVCVDRPTACPDPIFQATCACDGTVYGSACDAYLAGADLNEYGTCPLADGAFACGYLQCDKLGQYCQHTVPGVPDAEDSWECVTMPACPTQWPTCGCLAGEPCGSDCTGDFNTGLTLTCNGI